MVADLTRPEWERMVRRLLFAAGLHSFALGAAMLAAPVLVLRTFRFPMPDQLFFPSQSGIFLVVLGLCYLHAVVEPTFVWTILVSKSLAVVFLLTHLLFFSAPAIIWAAAAIDGAFFVGAYYLLARAGRLSGVFRVRWPDTSRWDALPRP